MGAGELARVRRKAVTFPLVSKVLQPTHTTYTGITIMFPPEGGALTKE